MKKLINELIETLKKSLFAFAFFSTSVVYAQVISSSTTSTVVIAGGQDFVVNAGVTLSHPSNVATAGSSSSAINLPNFTNNGTFSGGAILNPFNSSVKTNFINNGVMSGAGIYFYSSVTLTNNASGEISGTSRTLWFVSGSTGTDLTNNGYIQGNYAAIRINNGAAINNITNNSTGRIGRTSNNSIYGIEMVDATISTLVNYGSIRNGNWPSDTNATINGDNGTVPSTITTLKNYGIINNASSNSSVSGITVTNLYNSQSNFNFKGNLPTNYYIYIDGAKTGKITFTNAGSSTLNFAIDPASTLPSGTYNAVLNGINLININSGTSGVFNGKIWTLVNPSGTQWNLVVTDNTSPIITGPNNATGLSSSLSVNENSVNVHTFFADEPVSWTLGSSKDEGLFNITSNGNLVFRSNPDYENPLSTLSTNNYLVDVIAADASNNSSTQTLTLTVLDINEAASGLNLNASTVAENIAVGTVVGTLSAFDLDVGDTFTYALVSGTGSADNSSFTISGASLKTDSVFDFENKSSYSIRIRVTDAGNLSFERGFVINVTNVNEGISSIALNPTSIDENSAIGTIIGSFSTTDLDLADTHTYSFVSGGGDVDNSSFQILGNQIKPKEVFNFEEKSIYTIRVRSTDLGGLNFESALTIIVGNLIEIIPPVNAIANQTYTGSALTPAVVVKDGNTTLTATTDYTAVYTSNTNLGTATVTITGAGNYSGTKTQTFAIVAKVASTLTIDAIANQTYTGAALTPAIVVKDDATTLTLGIHYSVAYTANTELGTATVTITGMGNYTGTKTQTFGITNWTARTSAADNAWNSIAYGNGLFVAVAVSGVGNRIMTSPDGISWTARTSIVNNFWYSVTYGNGLFVAVAVSGVGNRVMTSPDGITWTARTSAADNSWNSVTYGNGLFVAVAISGTNRVMTSPDGITWTARSSAADNSWASVTYGNGLFVAVSYNGTNRIMTSSNGINWTARSSAADNSWTSVTYGNGLFVAVAYSGVGNRVMTSPDGITWTAQTSAADNIWISVTYGNGLFVAVSDNGTDQVMTSPDGITWTARKSIVNNVWNGVTYGNGLFVAVAGSGSGNRVMTLNAVVSTLSIEPLANQTYTGAPLTPAIVVKDGATTLTLGTHYSVACSNNTNVGTATVTITGIGNYTGTKVQTFVIVAKAASTLTIDPIINQTYTGAAISPSAVVKDGNIVLILGIHYSVACSNNTNVGTATVTITGIGNYTGTKVQTFVIVAKVASTLTIVPIINQIYTGAAISPSAVVKDGNIDLILGTHYSVACSNNTNVGTATVTITGAGNYSGTKTQTFSIVAKAASTLTIDTIINQTYTGAALTPTVVVKDGNTTLTATTDYTVVYTSNTNVGTSTVTITGAGNYSGTNTQTFTIVAKAASTLTIDAIANQTYMGSALTPAVVVKNGSTTLTTTTDYTVAYTANTNVGTATVTITGAGNYSGTKTQTFSIVAKAASTLTIDAIASQTYTGAALTPAVVVKYGNTTLTLTTDYTVAYTSNTNAGTAKVTLTGKGNYTGSSAVEFNIAKASLLIEADNKRKIYGEANPTLTVTYRGLLAGQTAIEVAPTLTTIATVDAIPGLYPILLSGGADPNYVITLVSGQLEITKPVIGPVQNLVATIGDKSIALDWDFPLVFGTKLDGYLVEISEDGVSFVSLGKTVGTDFNALNLKNNQRYWFRVSALVLDVIGEATTVGPAVPLAVFTNSAGNIPQQSPGSSAILVNGTDVSVSKQVVANVLISSSESFQMRLQSFRSSGAPLAFIEGMLVLERSGKADVNGEGFKSKTMVSVWLIKNGSSLPGGRIQTFGGRLSTYSAPGRTDLSQFSGLGNRNEGVYFLGLTEVKDNGLFSGQFDIPDGIPSGTYTLQATGITASGSELTLSVGALLPADLEEDGDGDGVVDFLEEVSIQEVQPVSIEVAWGDEANVFSKIPSNVLVLLGNGKNALLDVKWKLQNLKNSLYARGSYEFEGEIQVPIGVLNSFKLKAKLRIKVAQKPAPRDVTIDNSTFVGSTSVFFIGVGAFQVNDPVDNIHVVSFLGDGYDNKFFFIKDNILHWNSADRAPGKTTFSIVVRVTDRDGNTLDKFFTINRTRLDFNAVTIYNTYSPTGDRFNDTWGVPELRFYEGVRISVYDRGGSRLFYTENPDIRWDGTFEGKEMPVGSYFWVIQIEETGETRRGMLNLMRK
jgi:gliding motility-associated-like protein